MMKELPVQWFKHLPEKDQGEFIALVRGNHRLLSRLLEIIDQRLYDLDTKEETEQTYKEPSYAYLQAFINGRRASLKDIRKLLDFMEDK